MVRQGAAPGLSANNTATETPPEAAPVPGRTVSARTGDASDDPLSGENNANARKYCANITAAATDARFAWQSKKLLELETKIKTRIAELDAKEAELKSVLERREAFSKKARETLVGIYAKMNPESAAAQIGALDDEMATAVLSALTPRQASAIFDQITPAERAAKLAGLLANPLAPPADKKL